MEVETRQGPGLMKISERATYPSRLRFKSSPFHPMYETPKYLKLMADYCADGVWAKEGYALGLDDIPISQSLKDIIAAWSTYYDCTCQDYLPKNERTKYFDTRGFNREGQRILRKLIEELPGWTIVHHKE